MMSKADILVRVQSRETLTTEEIAEITAWVATAGMVDTFDLWTALASTSNLKKHMCALHPIMSDRIVETMTALKESGIDAHHGLRDAVVQLEASITGAHI